MAAEMKDQTTEGFLSASTTLSSLVLPRRPARMWLVLGCVVFTVVTLLDVALSMPTGGTTSYPHLVVRAAVVAMSTASLVVFRVLRDRHIALAFAVHAAACLGVMLLATSVAGLFGELHPDAYRDAAVSMALVYPLILLGVVTWVAVARRHAPVPLASATPAGT